MNVTRTGVPGSSPTDALPPTSFFALDFDRNSIGPAPSTAGTKLPSFNRIAQAVYVFVMFPSLPRAFRCSVPFRSER